MKRVLIVDDKADNRYLLRVLLEGHGFEVDAAQHGAEALTKAMDRPPDLVISDLLMPQMDGYSLLRNWRTDERLRAIPFIVYTATYTDPKDEELALQLGADAFIVKPTEPELFMEHVQEVLDRERGSAPAASPPKEGADVATLKLYNDALIRRLEHKCEQLDERIAELIRSEANVIRISRCHNALSETNHAINHIADRDNLLQTVCRIAVERGGFALAWIGMLDAATGNLVPAACCGGDQWPALLGPRNLDEPRTSCEHALAQGQLYLSNDLQTDPAMALIHQHLRDAGLNASASCPLRIDKHVVGALTVFASEKYAIDEALKGLVMDIAAEVSFALESYESAQVRVEAEEELRRLNSELASVVQARTAELAEARKEFEAFSFSVSHGLRAPLSAIGGFTRSLIELNERKLDDSSLSILKKLGAAVSRMEPLIDDLSRPGLG